LAISFFLQAWIVSQKGPVFSALFNPLSAVIVTFFGALYLKEQTYLGRYAIFLLSSLRSVAQFTFLNLFCSFLQLVRRFGYHPWSLHCSLGQI
jgi:hypothetical protein